MAVGRSAGSETQRPGGSLARRKGPTSFQKQTTKKTQRYAPEDGCVLSLIELAANLDDHPLCRGAIGNLSIILKELKSINATRTQQLRRSRALRRYVE